MFSQNKDYYGILNISNQATEKEIKSAYRSLAKEYHPDKNLNDKGAGEKFKEISEAYEHLHDPQKKIQYDMFHTMPFQMGSEIPIHMTSFMMPNFMDIFQPPEDIQNIIQSLQSGFGMGFQPDTFTHNPNQAIEKEIFNSVQQLFSGHMSQRSRPTQKAPIKTKSPIKKITVPLTFTDLYLGSNKQITITRNIKGTIKNEILDITIPIGMDTHKLKTFIEKGDLLEKDSICGDVQLSFKVSKHSVFKKFDHDLIIEKKILLSEALCGYEFDITLPNHTNIHIISEKVISPKITKTISGLGFPYHDGQSSTIHYGDVHVLFKIVFPEILEKKQKQLLYKLLPKRKQNTSDTQTRSVDYDHTYAI
tara:strand:+ start:908 stop:1996 length:1089 start_codon:yes stop_codon:yes gene_type:complete